jgi:hypothetical protein
MTKDEDAVQNDVREFKLKFMQLNPHEVAFPRGVNAVDKYIHHSNVYVKGTPIHVRGAILYNNAIDKNCLGKKLTKIKNGDKIKFAYLKMPNPIQENVIAFPSYLPKELQMDHYIDYEKQFEKTFLNVIDPICNSIGWSFEKKSTLSSFFE